MKFFLGTFASAAVFVAVSLAPAPSVAQSGDGILVYNAQHTSLTQAWAAGFTRETGIKVTLRNGGDTEIGNQIVQEGTASPADVFLTENSPAMVLVDSEASGAQPKVRHFIEWLKGEVTRLRQRPAMAAQ